MFDALASLRVRTREKHRQLEGHGIFSRMMACDLSLDEYGKFLATLATFYGGVEPMIFARLDRHRYAPLYRRRLHLLCADLHTLGRPVPVASSVLHPPPRLDAALLGMIYAIEGSAHGGQRIAVHCRKVLGEPALPAMRYVSELSPLDGGIWAKILDALRTDLACETDVDCAIAGVSCVFDGLIAADL